MPNDRKKSIRIRISEEEFRILSQECERTGSKTVVQLAREAIHDLVDIHQAGPGGAQGTRSWLTELVCRLTSLQAEIERLERLLKVQK